MRSDSVKFLLAGLGLLPPFAVGDECLRFTQYNSQREGNANLEEDFRTISTAAACSGQCQLTEGCACFSYNQDNNRCFLMSACKTPTWRHNFVAGPAGCSLPEPSEQGCRVTVKTATPGAAVLRNDRKGAGRILQKVGDCAGGGALFKVEWGAGSSTNVRSISRVGCRHSSIELYHDGCANEQLLVEWEVAGVSASASESESEIESAGASASAATAGDPSDPSPPKPTDLIVHFAEMPELTGRYHRDGSFRKYPMWRSDDCNNGGLGCVLFSSGGGYWMIANSPDGHTRNVGSVKSEEVHKGESPMTQRWQVLIGREWKTGSGAVDTEEGMTKRGIDWKGDQYGLITVFIPEVPSLVGTYRATARFRNSPLYRSADCPTGACVLFISGGGFWMISGREDGHLRNVGLAKTTQLSSAGNLDAGDLSWEFLDHQEWMASVGSVGPTPKLSESGFTVQEATLIVSMPDAPEVNGLYRAEGRHRGLPLFRSDDCSSTKCVMFASSLGRWIISEYPGDLGILGNDSGRARSKHRIPHGRVGEDGTWVLTMDWEGQRDLEPTSFEHWEYQAVSGSWKPTPRGHVLTRYEARKRNAM
eukprot:Hpha_TRINITY_DN16761_c0_g2::TRINITY_DN16761_c0_g2_i1::g.76234::m.76234